MTSFLSLFCSRTQRGLIHVQCLSRKARILPLNTAVTAYISSFIDFTLSPFLDQELTIADKYLERCSEPALRYYIHALPEILTVMDLSSIYNTDFDIDQDALDHTRTLTDQAQRVLHYTFARLIDTSRQLYDNKAPHSTTP